MLKARILVAGLVLLASSGVAYGQAANTTAWASFIEGQYRIVPNLTYQVANNFEAKLDLYLPTGVNTPVPAVINMHGGGWTGGSKESDMLRLVPYLEMGFAVVNVEYRLARVSLAPAAVEDCLCALRWVIRNAKEYNLDANRIVLTGHSAGAHLAMTTGMIPASAGLDRQCPGNEQLKAAAIVNWYGITDVADLLDGPNMKVYAVTWLGSMPNRVEVARRVSPLSYVRKDMPPMITIHGDADPTVPYRQAIRMQEALKQAGVDEKLVTIPGGKHGGFSREETLRAYSEIRGFLGKHGIVKPSSTN
jgi:acetyl esterase/lipase